MIVLKFFLMFYLVSSRLCVVVTREGVCPFAAVVFSFCRVDITQRGVTRVVLLMCHVGSTGPRAGIRQSRLHEIKTF